MNNTIIILEKISAQRDPNGKTITLTDEICSSWGYSYKKSMVSAIGTKLSELGYDVVINHKTEIGRSKIFKIHLNMKEKNVLLFSNDYKDEDGIAFINSYPSSKAKEIVELILSFV